MAGGPMLFTLAAKAAIAAQQKTRLEQLVRWLAHNEPAGFQ